MRGSSQSFFLLVPADEAVLDVKPGVSLTRKGILSLSLVPLILLPSLHWFFLPCFRARESVRTRPFRAKDRKSTRLNSSHTVISYAVFCLKKKTPLTAGPSA